MADYFLVEVPESPMVMSGAESQRPSRDNSYEPCWIPVTELDLEDLQPAMGQTTRPPAGRHAVGGPFWENAPSIHNS